MSSTLATGFGAICSPNRNQACLICGSTPILFSPVKGFPSRIHPHPTSPDFGPLSSPERTRILISSSPSHSVSHTLIFFSCSYVRKNWRESKGTQARRVDIFVGQNARLTKEFWLFLYFSSKAPPPPLLPRSALLYLSQ